MNLKHLYYFWKVAKAGGLMRAAEAINITPQTLSGQIGLLEESLGVVLLTKSGRGLVLTEAGKLALEYAEELFALSAELEDALKHAPKGRSPEFRVGVSDAVPKSLVFRLLEPAVRGEEAARVVCREWRLDRLLGELSVRRLDLVISDGPVPPSVNVRAYNHKLLESGVSFVATPALAARSRAGFPESLAELPLLLPGEDSALRNSLQRWFEKKRLTLNIVGEFDDGALMSTFGQSGIGVFPVPSIVEEEYVADGKLVVLGRTAEVRATYYALSVERRLKHPGVCSVTESARRLGGKSG